ncbi:MAG TPA: type II toxin-antitoxin system VapC family toxin [Candidatus Lokiarchaeia archaeon]
MKQNNNKITLDSSIVISLLKEDAFFQDIVKVVEIIKKLEIQVFISHITYAEIWVGVLSSKTPKEDEIKVNKTLYELFEVKITDLNITIARTAAAAFLKYKSLKGKREFLIPDFLIGAHAQYYTNSLLTTNPRDFLKYVPKLNVITPQQFIKGNIQPKPI